MKINRFNSINESHNEFLLHYGAELENSISLLKKLNELGESVMEFSDRIEKKLNVYDTNVTEKIDDWIYDTPTADEIAEFAMKNYYRWGTEPQMIIYAIEDYAAECGIYSNQEEDEDENSDEFYEGSFQFDKEEDEEDIEETSESIQMFEDFEDHYTYECSGSPKPTFKTKAEFVQYMSENSFSHTTLTKKTDMLIVESKDLGSLKCQKAEKYGIPIYTYREAKIKVKEIAENMKKYNL